MRGKNLPDSVPVQFEGIIAQKSLKRLSRQEREDLKLICSAYLNAPVQKRERLVSAAKARVTSASADLHHRIMEFISTAFSELSRQTIAQISRAPSTPEVIINLLEELSAAEVKVDPIKLAQFRGAFKKTSLLQEEGGCVTGEEIASILGVTRQTVDNMRKRNELIAAQIFKKRTLYYPRWQLQEQKPLDGLKLVLGALEEGGFEDWDKILFFLTKNSKLKTESPLDLLRKGEIDVVIKAAELHGDQGAH